MSSFRNTNKNFQNSIKAHKKIAIGTGKIKISLTANAGTNFNLIILAHIVWMP
jgi:CRISPR/Cas system-associated protein Csx1